MPSERIRDRPSLTLLFGQIPEERMARLLERLVAIDARLGHVAELATRHVGVHFGVFELMHVVCEDGSSAGIYGGPSGDAGDIWLDVAPPTRGASGALESWTLESTIIVLCGDGPEPRGESNTHPLFRLEATARSPEELVDLLDNHLALLAQEVVRHPEREFKGAPHDQLPKW
jgi:hypothetical protein